MNGELVVNVPGLQAAFSRASQQHIVSGKVKAHLLRHYRELGLDMTNFTEKEDEVEMATKKDIKEEEEKKNQKMNAETENKEKETKMEANSEDMSCKMEKETFEDDENKKEDTSKEEKENNDDKEDEEKVDYEAKYAEYEKLKFWDYKLNNDSYGVEPVKDILKRTSSFLNNLKEKDYKTVLIVSHAATIRAINYNIIGYDSNTDFLDFKPTHGEIYEYEI